MSLLPEQQRALSYARRRGTEAPLHEIRDRLSGTFSAFESLVEAIPSDLAREQRSASAWCIQEVVDHLVESDRRAAEQLSSLLAGDDVAEPIPAGLQSPDPLHLAWPQLLDRFRGVHRDLLDALSRASDATPLLAQAPVEMVVKCARPDGGLEPVHWVQHFDWKAFAILIHAHNREHIAQVQRILDVVPSGGAGPADPATG